MPRIAKWPGVKIGCQGCVNKTKALVAHLDECPIFESPGDAALAEVAAKVYAEPKTSEDLDPPLPPPSHEKGRVLRFKVIFNKPDDVEFNTLPSDALFDDIAQTIRKRYWIFAEHEIDVIWCSDEWNP